MDKKASTIVIKKTFSRSQYDESMTWLKSESRRVLDEKKQIALQQIAWNESKIHASISYVGLV